MRPSSSSRCGRERRSRSARTRAACSGWEAATVTFKTVPNARARLARLVAKGFRHYHLERDKQRFEVEREFPTARLAAIEVRRLARAGLEFIVPRAARRSRRVHADSLATRNDLIATYALPAQRIDVIHLGLGMSAPEKVTHEAELRTRLGLGQAKIVLSVAAALVHKNLHRLLDAFAALLLRGDPGLPAPILVLVGRAGLEHASLIARARALGIESAVRFTDWIDASDLEGLYRMAYCFVYPSLFEGFGMPVLEAMQRGTPVASSNASSLAEVAGEGAELFDPLNVGAISSAMERLLGDEPHRQKLILRGRAQAAKFTWQKTARETLASYERVIREGA